MSLNILLAEDDLELRLTLEEALTLEGMQVCACDSAESALDAAEQEGFDVAILDLVMPGLSGVEAIANLRRLQPGMGVIITTAFATVDTAVDAMKKGADEFLAKPFNLTALATTVRRVNAERQPQPKLADETADKVFSALSNPIRRQALLQLVRHRQLRFMDLCRLVGVEDHTKFNFHMRQLKQSGLIQQNVNKVYFLTTEGQQMCHFLLQEEVD
ncbi:response regulator [Ferrimonas balearica]|uniref:response regulator n=1 Tax=Ferrimonas balearica TaxID=44012 RepID=UPI001C9A0A80|nr:response regulator [Ferrimonas balearica]MBY5921649.1 response regulator [Ferrimonas balearica]MBY5995011.1 response regulator [Ferrimonas balearica]